MPTFDYAALDATGRETSGTLEAATAADAAEQLTRRGLLPLRTVAATNREAPSVTRRKTPRGADLSTFVRQLATLVGAALPLDQALKLVAAQNPGSTVGAFALRLADAVAGGRSLSLALTEQASDLPSFAPALVKSGETRGTLAPALVDLARILEQRQAVSLRVRGALLYPAVLIGVALFAVAVVLGVLVPTLLPLFQESNRPPPTVLRVADGVTSFVFAAWPVLLGLLALAILTGRALLRRAGVREGVDRFVIRLPVVGPLIVDTNVGIVARTLGMLLANGVPLVDALRVTASVAGNRSFRRALEGAIGRVKEGTSLSRALANDPVFPDLARRFIAIGEDASRLDAMLLHLADAADAQATRRLEGALNLLSPVLTIVIGVVIGGLILSVMQAILSVNDLAVR